NSRNGYGFTFGSWTQENSNNNSAITNNMGGTLTFTGNAWNNSDASARTLTIGGNGNTVIQGSINTSGAGVKVLSKSGSGSLTIAGTATTLNGSVRVTAGAVIITDFRSLNNNTAEISLGNATSGGGNLIIGGTGVAATSEGLTTSKTITLNTTSGSNSIYANQDGAAPVILNGAITKIAGATTGNLILGGTNTADNTVNVSVPAGTTGGLVKLGSGTWVLAAQNGYTGATTIQDGVLKLHATGGSSDVVGSTGAVTFSADGVTLSAAGTLEFRGFLDTATTEELGALTPSAGAVKIVTTANGTGSAALTFTSLAARAGGAAIDYQVGANTSIFFTTAPTVGNGILGATGTSAFQTFNGVDWATLSGNQVVAYTGYTELPVSFAGTGGANVQYAMSENSATTGTASVSTIKFVGGAGNPTLTLGGTLTLTQRAILFDNSAGTATITGSQLGASATEVHVIANGSTPTNALTIASLIGGTTGSFTKSGTGTVVVSGDNTFTGNVIINEGVVRLSGASATLGVNSTVGNSLTIRQGGTLDVNGAGAAQTIGLLALQGAGVVTNSGGGNGTSVTISLGRSTSTTATIFSGVIQDGDLLNGGGRLHVTIDGARTQALIGNNTYTGVTTIGTTAQLTVDVLANGGLTSGIGASSNAAGNLVFDGAAPTLIYRGNIRIGSLNLGSTSATTDRLFTISGAGAVLSSTATNSNAIVWSNFGAIVHGTEADRTLTLTGTSTGDNTFNPQLTDSSLFSVSSLAKTGAGQWNLGNTDNTYTGATTINEGILALNANGALSSVSPLYMTPTSATSVAVLQMSGVFERELSSSLIVLPGTNTVTFGFSAASTSGGVGFAAHTGPLTVAIGGLASPTALTWGAGGFVGTGGVQNLVLNSTTALSYVDFRNAIDFGDSQRTVNVLDNTNTGADYAIISGVLSGAGGGLRKIGGGILALTAANTYTGVTAVEGGTLRVTSLGNSGNAPNTATSVGISGTAMDNTNAITLGTGTTGGILQYVGSGETTNRRIRLNSTGTNQLHADGSGAWVLTDLANDMVTGARTLALRGSNVAGNMITSQLSDNGGALSITVDGGATWILTNSNNYTGTTTVSAGALGIGHDSAIGAGLTVGNGNVFAYNADRTLTNALTLTSNATNGWMGNYSLTFNGVNTMTGTTSSLTLTTINSISAGKSLTINGMSSVATAARNWNFDGPGETNLNGVFTSAAGVNLIKTGDGTLVLGTDGGASNWNQGNTNVDIDRGTLRFTANNAIPSLAGHGGLIVSPEVLTGDVSVIDLNGTSQTVNAFTMTSDGTVVIDNTSASAATFRFGANNSAISFGAGLGSYTVQNTGAGALSLVKLGNTNITFASNLVLNHQGTTAVEGGSLTIAAAVNGTTGLRVSNSGSALALTGGITAPEAITSVIVEGDANLSLLDGTGNQIINLTNLQLGSSGGTMTTLNFNVGDSLVAGDELGTDLLQLLSGGTLSLFAGNQITLNLTDVGLSANQTYDLIRMVGGGGLTSGPLSQSDWILGNAPGGFSSMTLVRNDDRIYLQTGDLITQTQYWRGLTNTRWNGALDNWSLDKAGTTPAATLPGAGTDVIFQWNAPTNAAVTTTLEQNFRINSLTFEPSAILANTPTSVTINPGDLATSRLDVAPSDPLDGVTIEAGGPASVTIAAAFRLGADQTWAVADAGSTLTFSGALFGEAEVTKAGLGTVVLSGAADPTFNAGQSTNIFVNEGKLIVNNVAALGNAVNNNLARVVVNSGGLFSFSGAASTLPAPITLNGGTLDAAGNTQTYSGLVTVASASTILMLDPLLVTPTGRSITLSGGLSGSGTLTVDGINTVTEGNQETGTLTINQDNSAWTGSWNLLRGSVSTNNANGLGAGTLIAAEKGRILFTGTARTQTIGHDILIASATETSVLEFNFATGISGVFSGQVTLGGAGGFGELRVHMSNDADTAVITGGVVLASDGGLGVRDAAARLLHVDSVISEVGGSRSLRINHQAWGGTAGTVRLTGLNTFSGDVVVARGTLEFNTVTNAGGAASSLGQGNTITLGAGASSILRFIGDGAANSQTTNRAINITPDSTTNYSGTLAANGTNGASITYTGPIGVTPNADGSWLVLTGLPGSQGFITGGITTVGTSADMSVTNGTWTIQDGLITIADDIFVAGEDAVLNLNSTGVWTAASPAGTSSGLYMRAGGTINLGANDINGANNANGLDFIMVGMDSTVGFTSTFNTNGFNITTPRLDVGGIADLTGNVLGGGTITSAYAGTDYAQGFRFFRGVVEANLAGVAAMLKQGLGTVTLSGNNSGLTGTAAPTRIDSGTLILDFTTQNNNK
ncbi:MAG: autotransporter-associated beta strand repeat-containing protein, partial [Planctomycetales bacterium]|nr:autotransporter-associated beta strand repeat-containing protein [Planctomycetales bacterium]